MLSLFLAGLTMKSKNTDFLIRSTVSCRLEKNTERAAGTGSYWDDTRPKLYFLCFASEDNFLGHCHQASLLFSTTTITYQKHHI